MSRSAIDDALASSGWYVFTAAGIVNLSDEVEIVAQQLGEIIPGRGRQRVEHLVPRSASTAYAGSLSSQYGLAALPLHIDTAHWPTPCRYLVMACAAGGPQPTSTVLLDSRQIQLSETESAACDRALFLIRNGRNSFYGSIRENGRPFLRIDPGCMSPLSTDGELALCAFRTERQEATYYRHEWRGGEILVIDNWRVLHGRGIGERTEPGRVLLRAMVR
jgi:alpha-ketoglutarate-dependent taurine dioxygenase